MQNNPRQQGVTVCRIMCRSMRTVTIMYAGGLLSVMVSWFVDACLAIEYSRVLVINRPAAGNPAAGVIKLYVPAT